VLAQFFRKLFYRVTEHRARHTRGVTIKETRTDGAAKKTRKGD